MKEYLLFIDNTEESEIAKRIAKKYKDSKFRIADISKNHVSAWVYHDFHISIYPALIDMMTNKKYVGLGEITKHLGI